MTEKKRILIVGGVAGGASAAARARRLCEDAEIVIFERGPHISFANCGLTYHIQGTIKDRNRLLVQTPQSMQNRFNIDAQINTEVIEINRERKEIIVRDLTNGMRRTERYDALIVSPGAEPVKLDILGFDSRRVFTLRSLPDMDKIKKLVDSEQPTKAVVIGGGYIGLEMTEALTERGIKVTILQHSSQVFGQFDAEMASGIHQHLQLHGVDLRLNTSVTGATEIGDKLSLQLSSEESLDCDLVILSIGVKPEIKLAAQAGLQIGKLDGIVVDEHMRTSDPDIYAVGDSVEVTDFVGDFQTHIPLAGPANRQGRIAADNIFNRNSVYKKTQGTAICKIFDLTAAMTGMNEKSLRRQQINYEKIYVHPADHAGYYPGSSPITLKLLFDAEDGKILGAQAIGTKGVDKRIDVIAVAIRASMTVFDLSDLELCYAPPYGSAKDVVNYAGFAASNFLSGDVNICHSDDVLNLNENQKLVDVRTPSEFEAGTIGNAVNIPLDNLRLRLNELPHDKELLVFCQAGLRGYLACRILVQKGFNCKNLTGGYKIYKSVTGSMKDKKSETENKLVRESVPAGKAKIEKSIDACGLQCPGPIMKLKTGMQSLEPGQRLSITSTDPGFAADIAGWCHSTSNQLVNITSKDGIYEAIIVKGHAEPTVQSTSSVNKKKTLVVFSNDLDKAIAAFIIANGAVSMGSDVTMFFTFWGLNLLRKSEYVAVKKTPVEKIFGFLMARGPEKTVLSKMNMAGAGTWMIKDIMKKKNVASLPELIKNAQQNNVRLIACTMTMELMGIKQEELIDGVEHGGVATYLNQTETANVNLFIG